VQNGCRLKDAQLGWGGCDVVGDIQCHPDVIAESTGGFVYFAYLQSNDKLCGRCTSIADKWCAWRAGAKGLVTGAPLITDQPREPLFRSRLYDGTGTLHKA
jgi:hypothetical protein